MMLSTACLVSLQNLGLEQEVIFYGFFSRGRNKDAISLEKVYIPKARIKVLQNLEMRSFPSLPVPMLCQSWIHHSIS